MRRSLLLPTMALFLAVACGDDTDGSGGMGGSGGEPSSSSSSTKASSSASISSSSASTSSSSSSSSQASTSTGMMSSSSTGMMVELDCNDDIDDDGDTDVDCADADCDAAAVCGQLVINEVDYDQPSADTNEFVEIFNAGVNDVDLAGVEIVLVNGASGQLSPYDIIQLTGTLPAGGYLVVASSTVVVDPQATVVLFSVPSSNIQNAGTTASPAGDAIAIYDTSYDVILDAFSYEQLVAGAMIDGQTLDVFEGNLCAAQDTDTDATLSLARIPNGADTDDNAADWAATPTLTPGAANVVGEICNNGVDDDGDLAVDCADLDCTSSPVCAEICDDMIDNDGDLLDDCADPDCAAMGCGPNGLVCLLMTCSCPGGTTEAACGDTLDNDCDAQTDCADTDCAADPLCLSAGVTGVDYPVITRGGMLVVSGSGFTGSTAVTIGGVAVGTFTVDSDAQITIGNLSDLVPLGAQPLVVTTPSGPTPAFGLTVINLQINEVDCDQTGTDTQEFVEISTGVPGVSLAGYTLVFWNGSGDISYFAVELNATTDANGLLVVGNAGVVPAPQLTFADSFLQQGADGVSVNQASPALFPNGTAINLTGIIDGMAYDTADPDDAGLAILYTAGAQLDENANAASPTDSVQRCGFGRRDLTKYAIGGPATPGAANNVTACP